jgi:hypothetical protein
MQLNTKPIGTIRQETLNKRLKQEKLKSLTNTKKKESF